MDMCVCVFLVGYFSGCIIEGYIVCLWVYFEAKHIKPNRIYMYIYIMDTFAGRVGIAENEIYHGISDKKIYCHK